MMDRSLQLILSRSYPKDGEDYFARDKGAKLCQECGSPITPQVTTIECPQCGTVVRREWTHLLIADNHTATPRTEGWGSV